MDEDEDERAIKLIESSNAKGVIRVTMTVEYVVPSHESRSLEAVANDWFVKNHLGHHHAYRDGWKIGFSEKVIDYDLITPEKE